MLLLLLLLQLLVSLEGGDGVCAWQIDGVDLVIVHCGISLFLLVVLLLFDSSLSVDIVVVTCLLFLFAFHLFIFILVHVCGIAKAFIGFECN